MPTRAVGTSGGRGRRLAAACLTGVVALTVAGCGTPDRPRPAPARSTATVAGSPSGTPAAQATSGALETPNDVVEAYVAAVNRHDEAAAYALMTPAQGYQQVVFVPVRFTLRQRQVTSMPDGPTVWGYLLARDSNRQPWLIADEGPA